MLEKDAVEFIVLLLLIAIVSFILGALVGSCKMQSDIRESLCRDMPTTEEYFQCKVSNDFNSKYKLVKKIKYHQCGSMQ